MLYHEKEKIYCLSDEDVAILVKNGERLLYDQDVENYYWIKETVKQTKPDFFEIKDEDVKTKLAFLGYNGENDVRDILDWFNFSWKFGYTSGIYEGMMITGKNSDLLEAKLIIDGVCLSNFLSIEVYNIDERSKYVLMKDVVRSMVLFFDYSGDKPKGPSTHYFQKNIEKDEH